MHEGKLMIFTLVLTCLARMRVTCVGGRWMARIAWRLGGTSDLSAYRR